MDENDIKSFLEDLLFAMRDTKDLSEKIKKLNEEIENPEYWELIPVDIAKSYRQISEKLLYNLAKLGEYFKGMEPKKIQEEIKDLVFSYNRRLDEEIVEEDKEESKKEEEKKGKDREKEKTEEELLEVDTAAKKEFYQEIKGKTGRGFGSIKGKWVRRYNRKTVEFLLKELEKTQKTKGGEIIYDI